MPQSTSHPILPRQHPAILQAVPDRYRGINRRLILLLALVGLGWLTIHSNLTADDKLAGIACRSVHLWHQAPEGLAFYNEIVIEKSAPGTYFMVCGWDRGYFGIQELGNGKKLALFSVWDSDSNDPNAQVEEERVHLLHKDPQVREKRFGGEGSGGQSFFDYDWKLGETYRFMVTAQPAGMRTIYSGYFYVPEDKAWKHLISFSTISGGTPLRGYYSFVEDFQRNRVSATQTRRARFGHGWVRNLEQKWIPVREVRFTADNNPALTIDAGSADPSMFFLATGGETKNETTKLNGRIKLSDEVLHPLLPEDLPEIKQFEKP